MDANSHIEVNLTGLQDNIKDAEVAAGRTPGSVDLVAVSKMQPVSLIEASIDAGQKLFGENRVQEAIQKWPTLKENNQDLRLHLIGALQSNKARQAVRLFDVIETIDRPKLARTLARLMDEEGHRPECLIQVNTGEEAQKAGIMPKEADAFIKACQNEYGLPVTGLMCIPPAKEEPSLHYSFLYGIAERNGLSKLSMGMSRDYEVAIRFGATHVRIGTAIFGERKTISIG